MKKAIIGKKIGMTQLITEEGKVKPVTVIKTEVVSILEKISHEDRGYNALKLSAYDYKKNATVSKPIQGQFSKYKRAPQKIIFEIRVNSLEEYSDKIEFKTSDFSVDQSVVIKGKTKGKGFAGTIKLHGFHRGPETHGSKNHRQPGSIGAGTSPSRVLKGTKMAGRMGNNTTSVKTKILRVDEKQNLIYVLGSIPGAPNNLIWINADD